MIEVDPTEELSQIEGSPAMAHLVMRCKDCRTQGNLCYDFSTAKPETFYSICRLDARNYEPVTFEAKPDTFKAVASDSNTIFEEVDLSGGEWFDYDEKESRQVSLTEIQFRIVSVKA